MSTYRELSLRQFQLNIAELSVSLKLGQWGKIKYSLGKQNFYCFYVLKDWKPWCYRDFAPSLTSHILAMSKPCSGEIHNSIIYCHSHCHHPVQTIISCLNYCSSHLTVHPQPVFNTVARKILLRQIVWEHPPSPHPMASLFIQGKFQSLDNAMAIWFAISTLTSSILPLALPDRNHWPPCSSSNMSGMFLPQGLCTWSFLSIESSSPRNSMTNSLPS